MLDRGRDAAKFLVSDGKQVVQRLFVFSIEPSSVMQGLYVLSRAVELPDFTRKTSRIYKFSRSSLARFRISSTRVRMSGSREARFMA